MLSPKLRDTTLAIIEDIKPKQVLIDTSEIQQALESMEAQCQLTPFDIVQLNEAYFDSKIVSTTNLVVLSPTSGEIEKEQAMKSIGLLRNHLNAQMLVLTDNDSPLRFNDMIALGFKREEQDDQEACLYSYDIASYNKKREWNNSRFWANPQNFNKYRW